MAIIPALLVTDNSLQQYFVDKTTGAPLANGIITFYVDDGGTTLKSVYEQTGSNGGPYTFVSLPNPLRLSSVGTPVDNSGNDIEIFYYPYDESSTLSNPPRQQYHVKVESEANISQFDRYNFPYNTDDEVIGTGVPTNQNLIVNNEFWRNVGSISTYNAIDTVTSNSHTVIAPSQHDGFYYPDIQVIKGNPAAADVITFTKFTAGSLPTGWSDDIVPEFYLDFTSSGSDNTRIIQIPISLHLLTLGETPNCCFTIQAKAVSGSPTFTANIYSDAGTGAGGFSSTTNISLNPSTAPVAGSWTKFTGTFTFPPSLVSANVSVGGDDAFYLRIDLSANASSFDIQFAKPSIYLNTIPPTNDFSSYDIIDSVICSPRTGDIRTSLNSFSPFGWVPCNDNSIGSALSAATNRANADTWPLYNLLWNSVNNTFAPVAGGKGASAYADFSLNKVMTLPLILGRALLGLPPAFPVTSYALTAPTWNSGQAGFFTLTTGSALIYVGMAVVLTGTSLNAAFTSGNIYYVIPAIDGSSNTQFQLASSYANALTGTAVVASGVLTGTSIVITASLGATIGEPRHVQLVPELAAHTHTYSTLQNSGNTLQGNPGWSFLTSNTGSAGSSAPFNIIQPSVFMNVYLKL